jgi:hypothetical protein
MSEVFRSQILVCSITILFVMGHSFATDAKAVAMVPWVMDSKPRLLVYQLSEGTGVEELVRLDGFE